MSHPLHEYTEHRARVEALQGQLAAAITELALMRQGYNAILLGPAPMDLERAYVLRGQMDGARRRIERLRGLIDPLEDRLQTLHEERLAEVTFS